MKPLDPSMRSWERHKYAPSAETLLCAESLCRALKAMSDGWPDYLELEVDDCRTVAIVTDWSSGGDETVIDCLGGARVVRDRVGPGQQATGARPLFWSLVGAECEWLRSQLEGLGVRL